MKLRVHKPFYGVCHMAPDADLPSWATCGNFWSVTRTRDELSIVTDESCIPAEVSASRGWTLIELIGPFDFDQAGILMDLIAPLAAADIPVLAIATYDTDYIMTQSAAETMYVLRKAGYAITNQTGLSPQPP